jgi:hypothetical protein
VARKGQKKMADTFIKDTSVNTKKTHAGKSESGNMPLATIAAIPTPTLKAVAQNLVALELDLADLVATGTKWHMLPYLSKSGKVGIMVFLFHPDYSLGVEDLGDNNLVALIDGARAAEIATRKKDK